jgi:RNA polymerase sigma-70 factor (ECF subfamily)
MLARTSADADDAAQQALLEILRSSASYRTPGNLGAWSDRIAARTVLHLRRQERSRENILTRWLSPGTQPWGGDDHAVGLETAGIEALFRTLSHDRREAMVLRHALGYSPEEIADMTGAPLGTVKDRLAAGRKQLRRLLERDRKRLEGGTR